MHTLHNKTSLSLFLSHSFTTHSLTHSPSVSDLKRHNPKLHTVRILLSRHLLFIFTFPRSASLSLYTFPFFLSHLSFSIFLCDFTARFPFFCFSFVIFLLLVADRFVNFAFVSRRRSILLLSFA